jgi:hypothetical protein
MDKRNKAFKNNKTEVFKSLCRQVSAEINKAKLQFYDKKVRPNHSSCPKAWWKHGGSKLKDQLDQGKTL